MCVCVWVCDGAGCVVHVHMHPPSPEAVLCIVVGMAYMLIQAWFGVVQYTRLPIYATLLCRVRRPASFTFAPELMLVNCHINSDLLPCFVNNINETQCVIARVIFALMQNTRTDWVGQGRLPKAAAIYITSVVSEQNGLLRNVLKPCCCCCCCCFMFSQENAQEKKNLPTECSSGCIAQVFHSGAKLWARTLNRMSAWPCICGCLHMYMRVERIYLPARSKCVKFS